MADDYRLNPGRELCARCGEVARGGANGYRGERLCHPDDPTAPDCYTIVTQGRERPYSTADFRADLAEAQAQIRRWRST